MNRVIEQERLERYRVVFEIAERVVRDLPKEARVVDIQKCLVDKPDQYILLGREMRLGLDVAYFTSVLVVRDILAGGSYLIASHYGMTLEAAALDLSGRIYR